MLIHVEILSGHLFKNRLGCDPYEVHSLRA
jgi:hypothetical protein